MISTAFTGTLHREGKPQKAIPVKPDISQCCTQAYQGKVKWKEKVW